MRTGGELPAVLHRDRWGTKAMRWGFVSVGAAESEILDAYEKCRQVDSHLACRQGGCMAPYDSNQGEMSEIGLKGPHGSVNGQWKRCLMSV